MMKQRKRDNGNFHNNKYTVEWKEGNDIEAKWSDAPNGFIHCAVISRKEKYVKYFMEQNIIILFSVMH